MKKTEDDTKKWKNRSTLVAQLVKHPIIDLSSGPEFKLWIGLHVEPTESKKAKWKTIPWAWIGRKNVEMSILPKANLYI